MLVMNEWTRAGGGGVSQNFNTTIYFGLKSTLVGWFYVIAKLYGKCFG